MTFAQQFIRTIVILALAGVAMAAPGSARRRSSTPASAPAADARKSAGADFSILLERNIFDRNRRPPVVRTTQPAPPARPPRPTRPVDADQYFVLRGIALEGSRFTAFFEDTRAGTILQVKPGDAVGKGRVPGVNIDSAQYQRGDRLTIIRVGCTLTGSRAPAAGFEMPAPNPAADTSKTPASASPSSATTQPTTAPAGGATSAPASGGLQDILERMRRRRQQELGR